MIVYYLFFKDNSKYDLLFYFPVLAYMMRSYNKTLLTYKDKLNNVKGSNKNIFMYAIYARTIEKINRRETQ